MEKTITLNRANWLGSEVGIVTKSITVPTAASSVTENGKKIVKSGTIFTTPYYGILLNDVDVTDGANAGALVVAGHYIDAKLPSTAVSYVDNFKAQGLFAITEGNVTRPSFGTVASLDKLSAPSGSYSSATSVISWASISNAVGYNLYLGSALVSSYSNSVLSVSGISTSGSYYLQTIGDNLYYGDSDKSTAITVQ